MKYKVTDLTADMNINPKMLGLQALLNSFLEHTSSQRMNMFASNLAQAMVIHGCEPPYIMTGFEGKFAKYEFDKTAREEDARILDIIPKFKPNMQSSPSYTVVYLGLDSNTVKYFDLDSYTMLHDKFGYFNKKLNIAQLRKDNYIPKDMKFVTAPNHIGNMYAQGVNANVAYLSMWNTVQDAFIVSKSFAKKCSSTGFGSIDLEIKADEIPLNLYGDLDEYKVFPDIGERVRSDGILIAFRDRCAESVLSDMTRKALSEPEHIHDKIHYAPVGAEVVDIQVFVRHDRYRKLSESDGAYTQFIKYQNQHKEYYRNVINVYERCKREHLSCGPEFNNLVYRCMAYDGATTRRGIKLKNKKDEVEFIHIKITYAYDQELAPGSKITSNDGAKGVVSEIMEDEDMPVDDLGIRADIVITSESPFNRLNSSQWYQQFFNRASVFVLKHIQNGLGYHRRTVIVDNDKVSSVSGIIVSKSKHGRLQTKCVLENTVQLDTIEAKYQYLMEYISDVRPLYGEFLRERHLNDEMRKAFVEECLQLGHIYLVIPPYCQGMDDNKVIYIVDKYNIYDTPVTYNRIAPDGTKTRIRTYNTCSIGSKYMYLLGKLTIDQLSSIEIGYVNQFGTPAKPGSKYIKSQNSFGQTPVRFGEDENANLAMGIGVDAVARLMGINANSVAAVEELQRALLTAEKPSDLGHINMTTEQIIESNVNVATFKHEMGVAGYDMSNTCVINPEDFNVIDDTDSEIEDDDDEVDEGMYADVDTAETDPDNLVPSIDDIDKSTRYESVEDPTEVDKLDELDLIEEQNEIGDDPMGCTDDDQDDVEEGEDE